MYPGGKSAIHILIVLGVPKTCDGGAITGNNENYRKFIQRKGQKTPDTECQ